MDKQSLLAAISSHPWLLKREALERKLAEVRAMPPAAASFSAHDLAAAVPPAETQGTIGVIPVRGIITHRGFGGMMDFFFGGTTVEGMRAAFRQAMGDPAISAVVFDFDSPGGDVVGVPELAAEILAARGPKPIKAVSTGEMESAAFWIASAADEVIVSPSASAGSIGVWAMHVDESGALEQAGLDVTLISAGKFKVEGNPFEPLGAEARAFVQSQVNDTFADFVKAVAKGRKVTAAAVRNGFGQGRSLLARAAVDAGLADRVATLEETLQGLTIGARRRRRADAARTLTREELLNAGVMPDDPGSDRRQEMAGTQRRQDAEGHRHRGNSGFDEAGPAPDKEHFAVMEYCLDCGEKFIIGWAIEDAKQYPLKPVGAASDARAREHIKAADLPMPDKFTRQLLEQAADHASSVVGASGDARAREQAHRMRFGEVDNPEG